MSTWAMDRFWWAVAATQVCSGVWMCLSKHQIPLLNVNHVQIGVYLELGV